MVMARKIHRFFGTIKYDAIKMYIYIYVYKLIFNKIYIQVVPGRAGGGSFKRKKNYIAKKEFAYRMRKMTDHCDVQTFFFGLNEAFAVAWL